MEEICFAKNFSGGLYMKTKLWTLFAALLCCAMFAVGVSAATSGNYTYTVTNWREGGEVYVNLLVYRSRIIGADISSNDGDAGGFVLPLCDVTKDMLSQ